MVRASFTSGAAPPDRPKTGYEFDFGGEELCLLPGRALYWPRERALLVADLHLEKASFFARGGQMLPPYDSRETLARLASAIATSAARRVIVLGDNFHDPQGPRRLEPVAADMLTALARSIDWIWLSGNHDRAGEAPDAPENADDGLAARFGGVVLGEVDVAGIRLRHQALAGADRAEISGHFHPMLELTLRHRRIRRPCAVLGDGAGAGPRLILPAFGALAGGMNAADPAIIAALAPARRIAALVPAGGQLARFCLWPGRSDDSAGVGAGRRAAGKFR